MNQFDLTKFKKNPDGSYSKIATVVQPRDKAMGKSLPQILDEQQYTSPAKEGQMYKHTGTGKSEIETVDNKGTWRVKPEVYFKNKTIDDVYRDCHTNNTIFIHGNVPSLKNSKQIFHPKGSSHPIVSSSDLCKEYLKDTRTQWNTFRKQFLQMTEGKSFPLKIQLFFIRDSRRSFDYGNVSQIVWDAMTGSAYYPKVKNKTINESRNKLRKEIAWMEDDDADHLIPDFSAGYGYDPKLAGVIIKIL